MSAGQAKNGPRTGPRTARGRVSIINANVINGARCFVPVLEGESETAWRELLDGIRARIQPADCLEEEMVYHLSLSLWQALRLHKLMLRRFQPTEKTAMPLSTELQQALARSRRRSRLRDRCVDSQNGVRAPLLREHNDTVPAAQAVQTNGRCPDTGDQSKGPQSAAGTPAPPALLDPVVLRTTPPKLPLLCCTSHANCRRGDDRRR